MVLCRLLSYRVNILNCTLLRTFQCCIIHKYSFHTYQKIIISIKIEGRFFKTKNDLKIYILTVIQHCEQYYEY